MRKYEIAHLLAKRYGYTNYLEICTPTTGGTFSHVDKQQFSRRVRIMYKASPGFSDGEPIDFFTEDESGEELLAKVVSSGERFDLVLIDSFHTYTDSLRDIVYGLQLIKSDGIILVHDCFPTNEACTAPSFIPGEWLGLTFAAYLDVVLFTKGIHYATVHSDYGCGIISKDNRLAHFSDLHPNADLIHKWRMLDLSQKYPFFEEHHAQLLRLVSPNDFHERLLGELMQSTVKDIGIINANSQQPTDVDALQNDLVKTRIALDVTQGLLDNARNALQDTDNNLKIIKNTLTWKLHEYITRVSIVQKIYLTFVKPFKHWLSKADSD